MALQVISALVIIGLVLVQHGKGADMGAAFGSGASGSLFGATGSSSFLSKATGVAATIFFCATLALAYLGNRHTAPSDGVMDNLTQSKTVDAGGVSTTAAPTTAAPVTGAAQPATAKTGPAQQPAPAAAPVAAPAKPTSAAGHSDQIPK